MRTTALRCNGYCAIVVATLLSLFAGAMLVGTGGRWVGDTEWLPVFVVVIATTGIVCLVVDHRLHRPVDPPAAAPRPTAPIARPRELAGRR